MIDLSRVLRAVLVATVISIILVYASLFGLVSGQDGASISFATAVYAGHGEMEDPVLDRIPGADQIAGMALMRSFDLARDGGCPHLMHASAAIDTQGATAERERLFGLIWSYASMGADLDLGCDDLGAPVLWDAVLDMDRARITLLLRLGADPDAAVVRTHRNTLGLDLRGLIALMRIRHAEQDRVLVTLDQIEAELWSADD
jgi:hypothetical protein